MKLAAIYNVWDGEEHLEKSYNSIKDHCDIVIAVVQTVSNHGQYYDGGLQKVRELGIQYITYNHEKDKNPTYNERKKRNKGIELAYSLGATHFILMDCDEVYPDFARGKEFAKNHDATVCQMVTYFGNENLILDPIEDYYVPFISKIEHNGKRVQVGNFDNGFYCDPTRKPNIKAVLCPIMMHHYSYVRNDISRKLCNSSAYINIKNKYAKLVSDYENAQEGNYVESFDRHLKRVVTLSFLIGT